MKSHSLCYVRSPLYNQSSGCHDATEGQALTPFTFTNLGKVTFELTSSRPLITISAHKGEDYGLEYSVYAAPTPEQAALHAQSPSLLLALLRANGQDQQHKICTYTFHQGERLLDIRYYQRNSAKPDGLSTYCRQCETLRNRLYRRAQKFHAAAILQEQRKDDEEELALASLALAS